MSTVIHPEAETRRRDFLDSLYRRYSGSLLRFLSRRRVGPEDAREIVQETYCRMQQVAGLESLEYPRAYLFRTALNLAEDGRRQQRRSPVPPTGANPAELDVPSEEPTAYRVLKGQQEVAIIRQALTELQPKCRRAFVMHRFEGATYQQIAGELGLSVSMIEKYISQALAHLKTRLDESSSRSRPARIMKSVT
jgi:RNA polymerase sigma factor (sigma-70 family)